MSRLAINLLGPPRFERVNPGESDGEPVSGLKSAKARALLSFLAVTGRPHTRPTLAGLLWGEMPDTSARTNMRRELSALRRSLGKHLIITHNEVAFNRDVTPTG